MEQVTDAEIIAYGRTCDDGLKRHACIVALGLVSSSEREPDRIARAREYVASEIYRQNDRAGAP